jgi:hypothetical protein
MSRDREEWKVGDRVQWIDYEKDTPTRGAIHAGVISALTMATREKRNYYNRFDNATEKYVSHVTVKWDDGEEETLNEYDVQPEDTEMEREFRKVAPSILDQIYEKVALANKYLTEAEQLSEEHGIPFGSGISSLGQDYFPSTFPAKWNEVSKEVMQEVTDTHNEHDSYYGWVHSSVC